MTSFVFKGLFLKKINSVYSAISYASEDSEHDNFLQFWNSLRRFAYLLSFFSCCNDLKTLRKSPVGVNSIEQYIHLKFWFIINVRIAFPQIVKISALTRAAYRDFDH